MRGKSSDHSGPQNKIDDNVSLDAPAWDLSQLYPIDNEKVFADLQECEEWVICFVNDYRGRVLAILSEESLDSSVAMLQRYETIEDRLQKIDAYSTLLFAMDHKNEISSKLYGDLQDRITLTSSKLVFFILELTNCEDSVLAKISAHGRLKKYAVWISDLRLEKPYLLEERLETLLQEKMVTSQQAWTRFFDETLSRLELNILGKVYTLEEGLNFFQNPRKSVRLATSKALSVTLERSSSTTTTVYNTIMKDKSITDRWRGFCSPEASMHLHNRVEPAVIDVLEETVVGNYAELTHQYYAVKAKLLDLPMLHFSDRNAPYPGQKKKTYTWETARDLTLAAYHSFSQEFYTIAKAFFDENRIDACKRNGKTSGAFAHPVSPSASPYILLTFQGKARDLMTLAHELGHGIHQTLAARQGALLAPTSLIMAETASIFGEMLMFKLLHKTMDPGERFYLLASKIEDMLNTVVRQISFYRFEKKVHALRAEGELRAWDINAVWMETQKESLGPYVELDDTYKHYWSYVPHFIHTPFYVYAYAFGDSVTNLLYTLYDQGFAGFQEKYRTLLAAGGSQPYDVLLAPFDVDLKQKKVWEQSLGVLKALIEEFTDTASTMHPGTLGQ